MGITQGSTVEVIESDTRGLDYIVCMCKNMSYRQIAR